MHIWKVSYNELGVKRRSRLLATGNELLDKGKIYDWLAENEWDLAFTSIDIVTVIKEGSMPVIRL